MADELMRFMLIGQGSGGAQEDRTSLSVPSALISDDNRDYATELGLLQDFAQNPEYLITQLEQEPFHFELGTLAARLQDAMPMAHGSLSSLIEETFGKPADQIIRDKDWRYARCRLNDSIVARKLVQASTALLCDMAPLYASITVVEYAASHEQASVTDGQNIMNRPLRLPSAYTRPSLDQHPTHRGAELRSHRQKDLLQRATQKAETLSKLRAQLDLIEVAFNELCDIDGTGVSIECPDNDTPAPDLTDHETLCRAWDMVRKGLELPSTVGTLLRQSGPKSRLILTKESWSQLSEPTKKLLVDLNVKPEAADVLNITNTLTHEQTRLSSALAVKMPTPIKKTTGVVGGAHVTTTSSPILAGGNYLPLSEPPDHIHESIRNIWPDIIGDVFIPPPIFDVPGRPQPSGLRPSGRGTLYRILQQIIRYEPGEISHIENILRGEKRERTHIRRTRLEQFNSLETETESEEERSLETTDRAELEREVERSIREQFDAKGGVKISGSYGMVSFEASAEVGYSRTSEDSSRNAQKVAREVTETAKQSLRERVLERRERRLIEEVEEVNTHGFDGTDFREHRSGVYQWLNKVYKAEVWDHGIRTMYDLLVPEPAAGLIHAATSGQTTPVGQPQHPGEIPYSVDELNVTKVNELVARFGVTETISEYPQDIIKSVSFAVHSDQNPDKNYHAEVKSIQIPPLYYPARGTAQFRGRREQDRTSNLKAVIVGITAGPLSGHFSTDNIGSSRPAAQILLFPYGGVGSNTPAGESIDVAVAADDFSAFVLTVTLTFRPNPEAITLWKRKAFAAIQAAYNQRLQEWRDTQTIQAFNGSPGSDLLLGRNPQLNRDVERAELQRATIEIMRNRPFEWHHLRDGFPSLIGQPPNFPVIDLSTLTADAPEIRFLQQAFEWENLTYVLYPYFYGRPAQWALKVFYQDADTRFVEFLKAGAARVQIPVRPGFEEAVDHYMMTGTPWFGAHEPTIGDDTFLSLYEETRARLGADEPERHVEEQDFEIVVPTSLIQVRPDDSLPRWEKVDGQWQEIPHTRES